MIWYEMISDLAMRGAALGTSPGGGYTDSSAPGHCPGHSHLISWSPDILATVLVTVTDMRHVEEHGMKLDLWLVQSGHVTWILTTDWSKMFTTAPNTKESQTTWSPDHLMSQVTRYAAEESTMQFVWWLCVLLLVEKHHTYPSPPDQTPWLVPWYHGSKQAGPMVLEYLSGHLSCALATCGGLWSLSTNQRLSPVTWL